MLKYRIDNALFHVSRTNFPAGEVGIKLNSVSHIGPYYPIVNEAIIEAHLHNNDEIFALLLLVDALRREYPGIELRARIPYVPYARQDRVCNQGEALSAAVMAKLINSCGFKEVVIVDPHSDVMPALIDNVNVWNQFDVFYHIKNQWDHVHIVAPDNGASKKASAFAKAVGAAGVIVCNKERELSTGKIINLSMSADVTDLHLLVLDDICDGGRTFIELAALTKGAKKVELAVTHGLFTKGVEVVAKHFHHVYTTDSWTGDKSKYFDVTENFSVRPLMLL